MKKKIILIITLILPIFFLATTGKVEASYNYSPWDEAIESAVSMSLNKTVDNVSIKDQNDLKPNINLQEVVDVFVNGNRVYVSDQKSNKIYVFDEDLKYIETYPSSNDTTTLNKPFGIFATDELLYVADSENRRVAIFDLTTKMLTAEITTPDYEIFQTTAFKPQRVVVDRTGRVLVIAQDIFEGIIEFDENLNFTRFYGTNKVEMNFFEALIYKFSSKKQKEKMALKLQPSFTSLDIDDYGYIYAVSATQTASPVKKLNFKGKDILLNNGYIGVLGDSKYPTTGKEDQIGPSNIIDVAVNADNNRFSILDNKRKRIFTYDIEGHLLYISGGKESLTKPTSINYIGEKIIVTDGSSIKLYEPTKFGALINDATKAYYDRDYETSKALWEEVVVENSNYFLAYVGIGKTYLRQEDYKNALINLELGHDYFNYSRAYKEYRNQQMKKILPFIIGGVILLTGYGFYKSIKNAITKEGDDD